MMKFPDYKKVLLDNNHNIYMIAGMIPLTFYAVYHLAFGLFSVGVITLLNSMLLTVVLIHRLRGVSLTWHGNFLLLCMFSSVVFLCYFLGIRGVVFIFPVIIGIFFKYPLISALRYSVIFAVLALLAALNSLETIMVARFSIPIIITIIISYRYSRKIEEHKTSLSREANQDFLTGISNRRSFMYWLKDNITRSKIDLLPTVYFIDIDNFKRVNDTYGHAVGDRLLLEISKRLISATRFSDPILSQLDKQAARIAGDEFVVAVSGINNEIHINMIGERLLKSINKLIVIDGFNFSVRASIGVATATNNNFSPEDLIHNADMAMFEAKKQGKNRIGYFCQALADEIKRKNKIASSIEAAIKSNSFYLKFMPIYDHTSSKIVGAEALIRNNDILLAYDVEHYIKIAEEFELIKELDLMVIEQSFANIKEILPIISDQEFVLAINISAVELKNIHFPNDVKRLAEKYDIPPHVIEFELTETSLIDHDESSIKVLKRLKSLGYRLSLDDFGTGYTAFNQLQHYPVDTLKIDKSFVSEISSDKGGNGSMIDVILSLANLYKLNVVAEGVEEQYQLDYLKKLNCSFFQGYFFSKPVNWQVFKKQLSDNYLANSKLTK